VRDEDRYGDAREALRRVLAAGALGSEEERTLRTFLAVEDESVIARFMSRLPRLANGVIAAAGGRE
jgi:hypothetical protein